jgi:hypothetical protein
MSLTDRELWTIIHGMGLGALFLLAFSGGLAGLYSLRPEFLTAVGIRERLPRLEWGTAVMAVAAWLTVITGTFVIYPWYRAAAPAGALGDVLKGFPKSFLLASEKTAAWHIFGMEWKEHVAWIAPMLATSVAIIVFYYGVQLVREQKLRSALIAFFTLAFAIAAVAGIFGAFINKMAPTV